MHNYSSVLRETYPYKTELHAHTYPVSECATAAPEEAVIQYKANGYHTLVLTNHLLFDTIKNQKAMISAIDAHIADFESAKKTGDALGINVLLGYELRFPESYNDYLFYGASPDFFRELDFEATRSLEAFGKVRKDNTLLIQAHPFRSMMSLAPTELIDGIEAFNMSPALNSRNGLSSGYALEENLLCICGSDFHHTKSGTLAALRTREIISTESDLVKVIKSGDAAWQIGQAMLVF